MWPSVCGKCGEQKKGGDKSHRQIVRNKQHKGFSVCYVDLFLDDVQFVFSVNLLITT
jgi:hypothetical protein